MYRYWRRLAAMLLTIALVSAAAPATVFASNSCEPGRNGDGQHYWAGRTETKGAGDYQLRGIQAQIENQDPWTSLNAFTSSWIMLSRPADGKYVQIGHIEMNTWWVVTRHVFIEVENTGDNLYENRWTFPDTPDGQFADFKILYDTSTAVPKFRFYMDDQHIKTIDAEFLPTRAEFEGEVNSSANQMTGTPSDPMDFLYARYKHGSNWDALGTGPYSYSQNNSNTNWFGIATNQLYGTPNFFRIWDKACS